MNTVIYAIQLNDPVKCPGCNWETSELHIQALTKDAALNDLKMGLGCCNDCMIAQNNKVTIPQSEAEPQFKAYKKHHGI